MSRLNSFCAVILLVTYTQFCNAEITIEDVDAQTTESFNTQSSEEWFDPMKQKQNQTVEEFIRSLIPDVLTKLRKNMPQDNDNKETDDIEPDDSGETSTIRTQDLTKSVNLDGEYETTEISAIESATVNNVTPKQGDDPVILPIAAELSSNKQSKMFEPVPDTVAAPVSQILSENTIYQAIAADQIGSANITSESTTPEGASAENQTQTVTTPATLYSPPYIVKPKNRLMQTTKPKIYKYTAEAVLRTFLDDTYIRKPMAALIDTSPNALRKTKLLWKSALRPNSALDIVLVAFNSSGVGVTYSFTNTRTMIAGLESVQESKTSGSGSAFFGIMRASELVPYDSAIFISTDSVPADIDSAQYAAITLLKKRIRLYLIWFGPQVSENNVALGQNIEGGILGEVAIRSGGEIIRVTEESLGPSGNLGLVTLVLRNNLHGSKEIELPIDSTVSDLKIKLNGNVETATLATPSGEFVDLLDTKSVRTFSFGSMLTVAKELNGQYDYEIRLHLVGQRTGLYAIQITDGADENNTETTYSVAVDAIYSSNFAEEVNDYPNEQLVEISWQEVDNNAHLQRSQRLVSDELSAEEPQPTESDAENVDLFESPEFRPRHFQFPKTEEDGQIDTLDETNATLSNEIDDMMGRNTLQAVTKIELGVQSQLLASPGQTVQIYYEVTNLREEPTFHNFQVVDEKRFLRALTPMSMWLAAGQTQSAIVTVYIPPNAQIGDKDKITFTSQGVGLASQAATLTVTSSTAIQDTRQPSMWWGFGSRCEGRTGAGQCASSVWSLEVSTQDTDTGILRVQSRPAGIIVRNAFTAGTNNEVKATYTSSCCTTRVTITSYDLAGNQRSHTVDVTEFILNEASIAAIALGVVLLVILICLAIGLIVWCCKRRKASRELPVYRSRGERERSA
ncbi:uncharacterized protein LOC119081167 [Bradysia coprophila]|uniref:uncharacterized protein LOC119081167 n=1 Tax=Bradysia coprophila TaxID=38358 RepID=UPI00187D999A|nr:uncharacterized protein LOC119081167 [Bradysia coprophila]XP_037045803.1 uncharacterized protein LOC119081167 [Bradysia coprophila]XP_037045804.1 uncharacterized protein LOC119081167 [Bradysia coprophila]XP_037045811.1 uncharacterized protein LOC119081167 [Bradysia coprophila]